MNFFIILILSFSVAATSKKSDHFDGHKFFNPGHEFSNTFLDVIKWKLTSEAAEWPESVPNKKHNLPVLTEKNKAIVTFINHATFLIQLKELNILTDPIFSERASPVTFLGPKRVRLPGVDFESLPPIDVVLLSHNHYDHMDLPTIKKLDKKFHPLFLVPLGNEKFLKNKGIQNVKEMDWWEETRIKDKRIIFTPALHWSARSPFDRAETLWGSFLIDAFTVKIYFAGDTGYSTHFKEIKSRLGNPNLALLPIGAYEPRWFMKPFHLNPDDAVMAHKDLASEKTIGMHFGTFQLSDEGFFEPVSDLDKAKEKFELKDTEFTVLDQGDSLSL